MARFRVSAYDPRNDSSENTEAWRPGYKKNPDGLAGVILDWRSPLPPSEHLQPCMCGCRSAVASRRVRFAPGHDARLKGRLTRAYATATPVHILRNPVTRAKGLAGLADVATTTALEVASIFSTDRFDWGVAVTRAAKKLTAGDLSRALASDRNILARALDENRHPGLVLLHVGKWDRTGHLLAVYIGKDLLHHYEWTDSDGDFQEADHDPEEHDDSGAE